MSKDVLHVVSFSGGKDSTAMLLMMLEKGMPVDEVIFCDTGKEFPEMYDHIDAVEKYIGRPITRLKADKSWDYFMFEHERTAGKNKGMKGYGWALPQIRWCTGHMKKKVFDKYVKRKGIPYINYIGIAYDEPKRHERKDKNTIHPLYDWQITEKEALEYCYSKGFDWGGLYKEFRRVSCWCCPLTPLPELRALYTNHSHLWQELKRMDEMAYNQFKEDYSVQELEEKFIREKENPPMNLCEILNTDEAHLIQKVKPYREDKILYPCIVEEKYDGVYCIAYLHDDGEVHIFSGTGKEYLSLDHLKPELKQYMSMSNRIKFVIFEAYADNVPQPTISGWCRDERNQHTEIVAIIHDNLTMNEYLGKDDLTYLERNIQLRWYTKSPLKDYKHLRYPYSTEAEDVEMIWEFAQEIWDRGGEGVIIKDPLAPYAKGKRNWSLMKLKQSVSYDLLITDVIEGQGKYKGMLGALVLQWRNNGKIVVGSGLTNEQRKEWWEDKSKIIGQIAQIDAMKESTDGVLREPVFKGVRYDKAEPDFPMP